jgi:RND family efflux transporter MFP subunit
MPLDNSSLESLRIERAAGEQRYATPKRSKRWLWVALGVLAVAVAVFAFRPRGPVVDVVAAEAVGGAGPAGAVLNASGYVVARRMATVSSKVTGRITEVLFEEGASVASDQVLARLDPASVLVQAELSQRELEAARRNLAEVEVRLQEARRNLERTESLRAQALVSETALDTARADVAALTARLAAQEAQRKVAEAGVSLRRRDLADLEIRAPFAGVVVSKDAQPGETVSPISAGGGFTRTGIATIVDMDSREIEVDVNESFINRVSPGQRVEATLDAYPDDPIAARVINIVPTADRQKATVRVRIGFDQLDSRILPDMGIKVRFLDEAQAAAAKAAPKARVPTSAIVRDGANAFVWVLQGEKVERRAVTLGIERDAAVLVESGVAAGEWVVAPAVEGLAPGMSVRRKQAE